ncbi:Mrx7 protein [Saccharomycopsis crataegensis]|uniref:Mrx7 protein n=1 Tax=Saccharomycopsis crataegensis TaxID=43959 RepID=A0AAV5QS77_9ASCO|nr:Mrx7 protein [Saccharomycopsis crataegensis]
MNGRPPRNIEELLYRMLMDSKSFHRMVQKIYCRVNGIPYHKYLDANAPDPLKSSTNFAMYHPTKLHKFRAWRALFWDEMKKSFMLK